MTKICINEQKIKNEILSRLNDAINNLNNSLYGINTLNIPESFQYANYLKKMMDANGDTAAALMKILAKVKNSITNITAIEKVNAYYINSIKITRIDKRTRKVN